MQVWPLGQQTPLQQLCPAPLQLLPGWPFVWLVYSQTCVVPLQTPALQVCTAQVPQTTVCPQLLMTLPHLPEQV